MARPRVFISSTFYDLKYVRSSLEIFVSSLGFEAILFEKGDIAFTPDAALDESCYREAQNADIFVLIIGGRYGSATDTTIKSKGKPPETYEGITRKEFETAQAADVPTFILVENAVNSEFQTFLRNKGNGSINYAHVDSTTYSPLLKAFMRDAVTILFLVSLSQTKSRLGLENNGQVFFVNSCGNALSKSSLPRSIRKFRSCSL